MKKEAKFLGSGESLRNSDPTTPDMVSLSRIRGGKEHGSEVVLFHGYERQTQSNRIYVFTLMIDFTSVLCCHFLVGKGRKIDRWWAGCVKRTLHPS